LVRDEAAEARDIASAGAGDALQAAGDRILAAGDRILAAGDRSDATLRAAAALGRDQAAEARDVASTGADDARQAVADRVLAAGDRREAALRAAAALVRDAAAEARDVASDDADDEQQAAGNRTLAAGDRSAAALDRQEAALDRRGAADELRNAYRDDLTDTLVRGAGRDQLTMAVDRAQRHEEQLVIAYLDVDRLKVVNDVEGHASGDRLLREVGSALRHGLRSYDVLVRYGGDEFVCALPGARLDDAERRFSDVGNLLSSAIAGASVSVGLAELREGDSLDDVIGRADREMYDRRRSRRTEAGGA